MANYRRFVLKYNVGSYFAVLVIFGCAALAYKSQAQQFLVEGIVETHINKTPNRHPANLTNRFKIEVNQCQWFIRVTRATRQNSEFQEVGYNGEAVYSQTRTVSPPEELDIVAAGSVISGSVPLRSLPTVAPIVWLAWGSGCFFKSEPKTLEAIYKKPHANKKLSKLSLEYNLTEKSFVPQEVEFFEDGGDGRKVRTAEETNANQVLAARYQVEEWKVSGETKLPSHFRLQGFRVAENGSSNNDKVKWIEHVGRATNIARRVTRRDFRPKPPPKEEGALTVSEYRLGGKVGQFRYTTNRWLTLPEVRELQRFERAKMDRSDRGVLKMLVLLGLLVLAGVLFRSLVMGRSGRS